MLRYIVIRVLVFIISIGLLLTLGKIWMNTLGLQGTAASESIEFSKTNNLFINEYVLAEDSITQKYGLSSSNIKCWAENVWHTKAKLVYFHPIQKTDEFQIILERPLVLDSTIKLSIDKLEQDQHGGTPIVFIPNGDIKTFFTPPEFDSLKVYIYHCPSSPPELLDSVYLTRKNTRLE